LREYFAGKTGLANIALETRRFRAEMISAKPDFALAWGSIAAASSILGQPASIIRHHPPRRASAERHGDVDRISDGLWAEAAEVDG
jgi:hypothetical protein